VFDGIDAAPGETVLMLIALIAARLCKARPVAFQLIQLDQKCSVPSALADALMSVWQV
jgi:hypothetical protein